MTAAIFGLIGVIAGALVAGLVSMRLERRDRFKKAQIAGMLICSELYSTADLLEGKEPDPPPGYEAAAEAEIIPLGTGPTPLSTRHYDAGINDAVAALSPVVTLPVMSLYSSIDAYNVHLAAAAKQTPPANPAELVVPSALEPAKLRLASNGMAQEASGLGMRMTTARKRFRISLAVAAAILVIAIVALASIPRTDTSTAAVENTLAAQLGPTTVVTCSPDPGGWSCDAHALNETRTQCDLSALDTPLAPVVPIRPTYVLTASSTCTQSAVTGYAVTEENGKLLATNAPDAPTKVIATSAPSTSDWVRAWGWLTK